MSKYKLAKKAYWVDTALVDAWSQLSTFEWVSYAGSQGKAKVELMKMVEHSGFSNLVDGDEITFLNLPVRRCKRMDLFEFEGKELTMSEIKKLCDE